MHSRNSHPRTTLRGTSRRSPAALALAALLACGGDSTGPENGSGNDGPIPAALASEWRASIDCASSGCSFTLHWEEAADSLDLLAPPFHAELDLRLQRNGSARLDFWAAGMTPTTVTGTARVEGSRLLLQGAGGTDTLTYSLSGNLLELSFHDDIQFEFREEPARARAVLQRR